MVTKQEIRTLIKQAGLLPYSTNSKKVMVMKINTHGNMSRLGNIYQDMDIMKIKDKITTLAFI